MIPFADFIPGSKSRLLLNLNTIFSEFESALLYKFLLLWNGFLQNLLVNFFYLLFFGLFGRILALSSLVVCKCFLGFSVRKLFLVYERKICSYGCFTVIKFILDRILLKMRRQTAEISANHLKPNDFVYVRGYLGSYIKADENSDPKMCYKVEMLSGIMFLARAMILVGMALVVLIVLNSLEPPGIVFLLINMICMSRFRNVYCVVDHRL